jgi:hypothetical protein
MPSSHAATTYADAGDDLDDADEVHELLRRAGRDVVDPVGEILRPVDEPVEELVDPHRERDRRVREPQHPERLVARVARQGLGGRRCARGHRHLRRAILTDRGGSHASLPSNDCADV